MPRTITIDQVELLWVQLLNDPTGSLHVYAEYRLKSNGQVIQTAHRNVTAQLTPAQRTAALAALESLTQQITTVELT